MKKVEWIMHKYICVFIKVFAKGMKLSKVSTQARKKHAEVRRRSAQLPNTVMTTGKSRDPRVKLIAMKLKARGVSLEK